MSHLRGHHEYGNILASYSPYAEDVQEREQRRVLLLRALDGDGDAKRVLRHTYALKRWIHKGRLVFGGTM